MRRLILNEFVSLDGMGAGLNGSVDFIPAATRGDESFGRDQSAFLDGVDTIVLGRVTYQMFVSYWPMVTDGPEKAFADKLNGMKKVVFSTTLEHAPWGEWEPAQILRDDPSKHILALKQEPGKDLVLWGSLSLAHTLIAADRIDEYRLVHCPIVLASRKPLFPPAMLARPLTFRRAATFEYGAVLTVHTRN
jgi:dihydrofolate reductase